MTRLLVVLLLLAACAPKNQPEPSLIIKAGQNERTYTRSQLLEQAETITIEDTSAYEGKRMTYRAVPIHKLFGDVPPDTEVHYDTTDGFSSSIPTEQLLGPGEAYLAVEDPAAPWPPFGHGRYGAGPFYLVWKEPRKGNVGREEWPFQLTRMSVEAPLEEQFPAILPQTDDPEIQSGYRSFVKNCFPCHTLNEQGKSRLGPDLNHPRSPTEYFEEEALRTLLRNPQDLRHWPQAKMPAFPPEVLPDAELDDLIRYLRHMAQLSQEPTGPSTTSPEEGS